MSDGPTRRTFLKAGSAAVAGAGLLASASTPALAGEEYPNSNKDAVVSAPTDAGAVLASFNQYPNYERTDDYGTLIEDVSASRYDIEHVRDLHTLLWDADAGETLDVREDAAGSEIAYESPRVPEVHVHNWFQFDAGHWADLYQDVLVSPDRRSLHVRNTVEFDRANEHTLYTLLNPAIDDFDSAGAGDEAYATRADGHDLVVATDGTWYLAIGQHRPETGQRSFDGRRIGTVGETEGPDRSAWQDVYEENDGFVDSNDRNAGEIDVGVGLYVGEATEVTWETVVGFGESEAAAVAAAVDSLEAGYESERAAFESAWTDWHDGITNAPTGDATADALYERSLTAMKCCQDPRGPTVAGIFEPHGDQYTYVWPRDQTVMIQSWLAAGAYDEALDALSFLDDVQIEESLEHEAPTDRTIDRRGTWWQNYYLDGTVNWEMLQVDQVGGPIYAHWLAWQEIDDGDPDSQILDDHYRMSELAAQFLLSYDNGYGMVDRHNDPWEENWGYSTEGAAAAIAGLRCMAELAAAAGDDAFARRCRNRADTWDANFDDYHFRSDGALGEHYVTCVDPAWDASYEGAPAADRRPDAAAFMAHWPWNVRDADAREMDATLRTTADPAWTASDTPCLDRYPGDDYTPTDAPEDGGWPLVEAYADVARWQNGRDTGAVYDYVFDEAAEWATGAGLLPERVDGSGNSRWNAHLNWSQAMYVLLTESYERGEPYGYAPGA